LLSVTLPCHSTPSGVCGPQGGFDALPLAELKLKASNLTLLSPTEGGSRRGVLAGSQG